LNHEQFSLQWEDSTTTCSLYTGELIINILSNLVVWRTWRRPPTSSLLLDWSCKRTRRRRRRRRRSNLV